MILITGGNGLVGSNLSPMIVGEHSNVMVLGGKKSVDLRDFYETKLYFAKYRPKVVIHLAGTVGGVKANTNNMMKFYTDNIRINTNVLQAAVMNNAELVVSLLSTCIYPNDVKTPIIEESLHNGIPHSSNYGYAHSKRMLQIHSRTINESKLTNTRCICLTPNNLYGPHDNFDLDDSHVIPGIIRKIHDAWQHDYPSVKLWGNGLALRQFTYVQDLCNLISRVVKDRTLQTILWGYYHHCNVGNPQEHSIEQVANMVKDAIGYKGSILWDLDEPTGQYKKTMSTELQYKVFGDMDFIPLRHGITQTCDWYKDNYPHVRGL